MKLLRIDSSARRNSVSRQLTGHFVEAWRHENPTGTVIERDLTTTALPHITDEWVQAIQYGAHRENEFWCGPRNRLAGRCAKLNFAG